MTKVAPLPGTYGHLFLNLVITVMLLFKTMLPFPVDGKSFLRSYFRWSTLKLYRHLISNKSSGLAPSHGQLGLRTGPDILTVRSVWLLPCCTIVLYTVSARSYFSVPQAQDSGIDLYSHWLIIEFTSGPGKAVESCLHCRPKKKRSSYPPPMFVIQQKLQLTLF